MVRLFWQREEQRVISNHRSERAKTRTISIFYIVATVLYFDHCMYFLGMVNIWSEWSYSVVNLCVYPLYYAYLCALTRVRRNAEVVALLAPAMIAVFLFPISRHIETLSEGMMLVFSRLCFALQVVWVLLRGYHLLRHTIRQMDDTYSDDRGRLLHPTRIWLLLFAMTAIASMTLNLLGRDFFTQDANVVLPAIAMSILLYGLGFIAAHTTIPPELTEEQLLSAEAADSYSQTEQINTAPSDLIDRIDTVMREQQLFTHPDLTIYDLAKVVASNRTYVSNAINRTYGIRFSQYVAKHRVEYAKTILADKHYSTDKAALSDAISRSGFASDQTFYRVFKEQTGLTPLQYRKADI